MLVVLIRTKKKQICFCLAICNFLVYNNKTHIHICIQNPLKITHSMFYLSCFLFPSTIFYLNEQLKHYTLFFTQFTIFSGFYRSQFLYTQKTHFFKYFIHDVSFSFLFLLFWNKAFMFSFIYIFSFWLFTFLYINKNYI